MIKAPVPYNEVDRLLVFCAPDIALFGKAIQSLIAAPSGQPNWLRYARTAGRRRCFRPDYRRL